MIQSFILTNIATTKCYLFCKNMTCRTGIKSNFDQKGDQLQTHNLSKQQQITDSDKDLGLAKVNLSGLVFHRSPGVKALTDRQTDTETDNTALYTIKKI